MSPRMLRRAVVPAALVICLATGCHAGASTAAAASPTGAPGISAAPVASSPIAVTVAPALVVPGAVHSGTPIPTAPTVPATAVPSAPSTGAVSCLPDLRPKQIGLQVSTASGAATVSWRSDGDATVSSYRVSAVSQQLVSGSQPAPPTAVVARGGGCAPVSLTLTGLSHSVAYVFWLEEGSVDPVGGALRYTMVGQSAAVLVP